MTLAIDHVIVCLRDLEGSAAQFELEHGVVSVPGGRHRGHGTANRLVPLGPTYIELVSVVDPGEARTSAFGRWVATRSDSPDADAIAIGTDDIDAQCVRLGMEATTMSRPSSTGDVLEWRIAGLEALVASGLPFFIQWDIDAALHPGRIPVSHPSGPVSLHNVTLWGDLDRLTTWTEGTTDVQLRQGEPKVDFALTPN